MKRILDLTLSITFLLFFGWFLLTVIAISAIIHKSKGIYTQKRIGKDEVSFIVYKIQSMRKIHGYINTTTLENDPRVTSFGDFIRKFKIDELLQVLNVLKGNMSIVGPRPTVLDDVKKMNDEQKKRFLVKPGLTGLAQINGNTELSWPQRILYDLDYVGHNNIYLDLKIIWKTFILIITNNAETHPKYDNEWDE